MSGCIVRVYIMHLMACTQNMYKVLRVHIYAYYIHTR